MARFLRKVCEDILEAIGVSQTDRKVVASCLIEANLRGVDSHGVNLLPMQVEKARRGQIKIHPNIQIIRESESLAVLDGDNGFGPVVATKGMGMAIEKAKSSGVGIVSVRNTNHFGMAACYGLMATEQGMIGVVMCNTHPVMAAWGGARSVLGSNPLCIAVPTSKGPLVLDMATSIVARGKIRWALRMGDKIPKGWALDKDGNLTEDPSAALEGALLPMGGPKGSGLALMIDILSGALSDGACGREVISPFDYSLPSRVGHLMMTINIDAFTTLERFKRKVNGLIREIKETPRAQGFREVLLPGEIELRERKVRSKKGIPLDDETWDKLTALAAELGVKL